MASFAKEQLLKYGWTEGKGLGKNENGIQDALKPKLKFDTHGVGHKEVEDDWWQRNYDSALSSLKVDKDMSIKVDHAEGFKAQKQKMTLQHGNFVKTATLKDGAVVREAPEEKSAPEKESKIINMSDEDLFRACGGRTAHKGARHGLTLSGKLARLAEQDAKLMKGEGTKRKRINSDSSSSEDEDNLVSELAEKFESEEYRMSKHTKKKIRRKVDNLSCQLEQACVIDNSMTEGQSSKRQTTKRKLEPELELEESLMTKKERKRLKKSKKSQTEISGLGDEDETMRNDDDENENIEVLVKHKKGKKSSKKQSYSFCTAEKHNAKIAKKKSSKLVRKERKLVEKMAKDLESSLVFDPSEKEPLKAESKKKACKKFKHRKKLKKKLKQIRESEAFQ